MAAARGVTPRRFRRRLLITLVGVAVVPLALASWFGIRTGRELLSLSFQPLEAVLDDASQQLGACGAAPASRAEVDHARLGLAQLELARHSVAERATGLAFTLLGLSVLLAAVAAALLGRAMTSRLGLVVDGIDHFTRGELDHHLPEAPPGRDDELSSLARLLNRLGRELKAQREQLRLTDKLVASQESARQLAHELKNPLTAMAMALGRLERGPSPATSAESLGLLQHELNVLKTMAQGFAELGRLPAARPELLPMASLIDECCRLYQDVSPVPVRHDAGAPSLVVRGDPQQLRRLVGNLVKNAVEASRPGDDAVVVRADQRGSTLRVQVIDHGVGLPDGFEHQLGVESTKPGGSGLGLLISQRIARDHGGALRLERNEGAGTTATIELPLEGAA
jgi:two-component system, NtrC family, nitrogen regulation sensor histidine kinase NtrY